MMARALSETLDIIRDQATGESISFGDIIEALNNRGFGALLVIPALIQLMPLGAIPGVTPFCALFIILIASQIAFGRRFPWVPDRVKRINFKKETFQRSVEKVRPLVGTLDRFFRRRFQFLTEGGGQRVVAVLCVILALSMMIVGFIPFAASVPALAILLFGISLMVQDGLLIILGVILMAASFGGVSLLF